MYIILLCNKQIQCTSAASYILQYYNRTRLQLPIIDCIHVYSEHAVSNKYKNTRTTWILNGY